MMQMLTSSAVLPSPSDEARDSAMIDFLRAMVVTEPFEKERCHVLFFDQNRVFIGDSPIGSGCAVSLSLRMRQLFEKAFAHKASGLLLAHNHPSGQCRPSQADIVSTRRVETVARTLDIELLDHLIFTKDAVYSMRAGAAHEFKSRQSIFS